MAYIVETSLKETPSATAATFTCLLAAGTYAVGDLLVCILRNQGGGTTIAQSGGADWTIEPDQANSTNIRMAIAWKVAASTTESDPVFSGVNAVWGGYSFAVKDAPSSSPIDGSKRINMTGAKSITSGALTTGTDNCLLVYAFGTNSGGQSRFLSDDATCVNTSVINANDNGQVIGYQQFGVAGVIPQITGYTSASVNGQIWALAIKNKTNGALQPFARSGLDEIAWYGSFGSRIGTITLQTPDTFAATVNAITVSAGAVTLTQNTTDNLNWGNFSSFSSTENFASPASKWSGMYHALTFPNLTGKLFSIEWLCLQGNIAVQFGNDGLLMGFRDAAGNFVVYQLAAKGKWVTGAWKRTTIEIGVSTPYATSGTLDWAAVTGIVFLGHRLASQTGATGLQVKNAVVLGSTKIIGGGAALPATFKDGFRALASCGLSQIASLQASAQVYSIGSVQIGDGAIPTYFDAAAQAFEMPLPFNENSQPYWRVSPDKIGLSILASASDTVNLASGASVTTQEALLSIDAAASTSASYSFSGESFVGWLPAWKTGVPCASCTFKSCGIIDFKGADIVNVIANSGMGAALLAASDGFSATGCTFTSSAAAAYGIRIAAAGTFDLASTTFSGFTKDIDVTATTGTVTINLALGQATPTYQTAGATVNIVVPSTHRGLAFTGLIAGSTVKVFDTGAQTTRFSTTNSGTSETWDETTAGSVTVDYTIQKVGYLPIRVANVTVTAATSGGVLATPIQQGLDRSYVASSGLTFGTNCFAAPAAKTMGLTIASTLQNFYSRMIESWVSEATLQNKSFPLSSNGPNSFTLVDGWQWDLTTYPNSIALLSRDGMRYLNSSGAVTAMWAAILSVGVPAGKQVRYQQADGTGTTNAAATGNIDQLIQILSDPNGDGNYADGYDKRAWLVLKLQADGYDQAEFDAVATYGNLEDQLYVVGLTPAANGVAAQAGITGLTLTDHGATPVTWNGKAFSLTVTDTTDAHSGTQILQWVRDANAFNNHDLVQKNGSKFKTVRGAIYGDTGAALKGVRVVKADGTTGHYDFSLFTADDGTTYAPPTAAPISWAQALNGTTVIVYNDSRAGLMLDGGTVVSGGAGYTLVIQLPHANVAAGDTIRMRHSKIDKEAGEWVGVMTESGLSFLGSQTTHEAYAVWGINGALQDAANGGPYSANATDIDINIESVGAVSTLTKKSIGAWMQYLLTLPAGLDAFYGAFTSTPAQIRQNVNIVDVVLRKNTVGNVVFTDRDILYYRSDFSLPYDPTGNSIFMDYAFVPFTVATGSGVTPTDKTDIASAVRSNLTTELARLLDLAKINGLVAGTDAVVTASSRTAGDVAQTITDAAGTVTVSRAA